MMKPEDRRQPILPRLAAIVLVVVTIGTVVAWIHTVRELNRLAAYDAVGIEALRLARSGPEAPDARHRERKKTGQPVHAGSGIVQTRLPTEPSGRGERP